ncbi:polysaccharide biosynthesis C-terminal domain-containing protein, partial [Nitrosomonas sp.]
RKCRFVLGTILSNVFLPHLSRNLEDHPVYMKIMMISGLMLTLGIAIFSDAISSILFSGNSDEISTYMRILSLWIIFIFIRNATGANYLMLVGREHIYKNIVLYTSVTSAVVGVYLIQKYQAYGAISVVVGSSFIMAVLTYWYYVQALDNKR